MKNIKTASEALQMLICLGVLFAVVCLILFLLPSCVTGDSYKMPPFPDDAWDTTPLNHD